MDDPTPKKVYRKAESYKGEIKAIENLVYDVQKAIPQDEVFQKIEDLVKDLSQISAYDWEKAEILNGLENLRTKKLNLEYAKTTLYEHGFELVAPLGKGGFGRVYRAKITKRKHIPLNIGEEVAIKLIDKELIMSKNMTYYVQTEIDIHSRLDHDSILKLYESFEDDCYWYFVLALCPNGDVQKQLEKQRKPFTEDYARNIFRQVVQGVIYLHVQNIMHRDIKPSNLLLDKNMNIKIADFGLSAQLRHDNDKHETKCGTNGFLAPEIGGKPYGLETDVFSLGCLLYNFVIGRPPKNISETNLNLPSHLSQNLKNLLYVTLRNDPKKRINIYKILEHPFLKEKNDCSPKFIDSGLGSSGKLSSRNGENHAFNSTNDIKTLPRVGKSQPLRSPSDLPRQKAKSMDVLKAKINVLPPRKGDFNDYPYENCHKDLDRINECASIHEEDRSERRCRSKSPRSSCCDSGVINRNTCSRCNTIDHHQDFRSDKNCKHRSPSPKNCCCREKENDTCSNKDSMCSHYGHCTGSHCPHQNNCRCQQDLDASCDNCKYDHPQNIKKHNQKHKDQSKSSIKIEKPKPLNSFNLEKKCKLHQLFRGSISDTGEVCIELFNKKKQNKMVASICQISPDGMKVKIYQFHHGGVKLSELPPSIPKYKNYKIFEYHYQDLPSEHWIKYLFAVKYINSVKSITPHVTYYSPKAKVVLNADLETCNFYFYNGAKIVKDLKVVNFYSVNGIKQEINPRNLDNLSSEIIEMWEYALKYETECKLFARLLENNAEDSTKVFPVTLGRRPFRYRKLSKESNKENVMSTWTTNLTDHKYPDSFLSGNRAPLKNTQNDLYRRIR